MLFRILIFTFFCSSAFHEILGVSLRSTQQDAQQAFQDLNQYAQELIRNFTQDIESKRTSLNLQLSAIQQETVNAIIQKYNDTEEQLLQLSNIVTSVDADSSRCVGPVSFNQIDAFRTSLTERAKNCTSLTARGIGNVIDDINTEMVGIHADVMNCNSISLAQCDFAGNDTCYDFVISNIEKAKETLREDFTRMGAVIASKIVAFKLPCRDLIEFELFVYPNLILQSTTDCVEVDVRNSLPSTC